jgi:hypothetical protein
MGRFGTVLSGLGVFTLALAIALLPSTGSAQPEGDPGALNGCNNVFTCDTGCAASAPPLCPANPPGGGVVTGCLVLTPPDCIGCRCRDTDPGAVLIICKCVD